MPTLFINNFIYKVIVFTFAMKQLFFDGKSAKLRVEDADDVYLLSQIVSMGDIITGKTIRKIKIGGADERQRAVEKKTVFLKIQAEMQTISARFLASGGIWSPAAAPAGINGVIIGDSTSTIHFLLSPEWSLSLKKNSG